MRCLQLLWLVVAILFSETLFSQWNTNPATTANAVCTQPAIQNRASTVPDFSGGVITVWEDNRAGTGQTDIYFERLNSNATPLYSAQLLGRKLCVTARVRTINKVESDGLGGFYIAFDELVGGFLNLRMQHVDASGTMLWGDDGLLICDAPNDQYGADFMVDDPGNVIIAWLDLRNDVSNSQGWQTWAQKINYDGSIAWANNGLRIGNTTSRPMGVVSDNQAGAIIACLDARNSTLNGSDEYTNIDVYAHRIDLDGNLVWGAAGRAICTQTSNQTMETIRPASAVVTDMAGGMIVAWSDYRNDPKNGLNPPFRADFYAQRINAAGNVQWAANGISICAGTGGDVNKTLVISDGQGGAIAGWYDRRAPQGAVYCQRITNMGTALYTNNGIPIVTGQQHDLYYDLAEDGNGNICVAYDTQGDDIFLYRFLRNTGVGTGSALAICQQPAAQVVPVLTSDMTGNVFVVWEDYRNAANSADLYAYRLSTGSVLPLISISVNAKWQNDMAVVNWETFGEQGITRYEIQRSMDGTNYMTIGTQVAGQGSTAKRNYQYLDKNLPATIRQVFYRVVYQELNGTRKQSQTVQLSKNAAGILRAWPQPAATYVKIQLPETGAPGSTLKLYNLEGQMTMQLAVANKQQLEIQVSHLSAGLYRMVYEGGTKTVSTPLVVSH